MKTFRFSLFHNKELISKGFFDTLALKNTLKLLRNSFPKGAGYSVKIHKKRKKVIT